MRLSTKGQYAVRAVVNLACHSNETPVPLRDISEAEEISLSYLEQLFAKLRRGKVVKSIKGPGGGYILAKPSCDISVGEVIEMVEEGLSPVDCLDDEYEDCHRADRCTTQWVWKGLGEKIREFLGSISIEELSSEAADIYKRGAL
jgi:Rrf2 family transcriptional regulator, iron-sulfur cluster assembly transcription factor